MGRRFATYALPVPAELRAASAAFCEEARSPLEERNSDYFGRYYRSAVGGITVEFKQNADAVGGLLQQSQAPDATIVFCHGPAEATGWKVAIDAIRECFADAELVSP